MLKKAFDSLIRPFDTPKYVLHNINKVNRHSRIYLASNCWWDQWISVDGWKY